MKYLTKENLNNIGEYAKKACNVVAPIVGMILLSDTARAKLGELRYISKKVKYDDAVRAIMSSSMWSQSKAEVVSALKKDEDSTFYKAVIDVVNSSMFSDDKVKVILDMCNDK